MNKLQGFAVQAPKVKPSGPSPIGGEPSWFQIRDPKSASASDLAIRNALEKQREQERKTWRMGLPTNTPIFGSSGMGSLNSIYQKILGSSGMGSLNSIYQKNQPFDPRSVNLNSPSVKNALYALRNRPESYLLGGMKPSAGAPMLSPEDLSTFMNYRRQLNQSLGSPVDFGELLGDNETYSFGTALY